MKNKLKDLNNILFEQLERLNDDTMTEEALQKEINRAKAICDVGSRVIENQKVQLEGVKMLMEGGYLQPPDAKEVLGLL